MVTIGAAGVFAFGVCVGFIGGIVVLTLVAITVNKKKKKGE
jgi:hypothetical protein